MLHLGMGRGGVEKNKFDSKTLLVTLCSGMVWGASKTPFDSNTWLVMLYLGMGRGGVEKNKFDSKA